jgi:hypothetical protein
MNGISNDQDVMDYSLNKASEELWKTPYIWTKNFIHNYLMHSFDWAVLRRNGAIKYNYGDKSEFQLNLNMRFGPQSRWAIPLDPSKIHGTTQQNFQ